MPRPAVSTEPKEGQMEIVSLQPVVALVAGILILVFPQILNYLIAIYLIIIGIIGLAPQLLG
jgi:hypothetical protein